MSARRNTGVRRKVVYSGGSLVIAIPSQLAQLQGIVKGDILEFYPLGPGELRINKLEPE